MKKRWCAILSLVTVISLFAPYAGAQELGAVLTDGRWYNDEFSFDFAAENTYTAYYTFGDATGSMTGKIQYAGEKNHIVLLKGAIQGSFDTSFMENGRADMVILIDDNDPKSTRFIKNEQGTLVLWNKNYFVPANKTVTIGKTPSVTMGYKLRETTDSLRIRTGPSIDDEYLTFLYRDTKSGQIKSWGSLLPGTNIRVLARTETKQRVQSWNNYWYYVEYKIPVGSIVVYKRAWSFAEFINSDSNVGRQIAITNIQDDEAYYGRHELPFRGKVTGQPVRLTVRIKNPDGTVLKELPLQVNRQSGIFEFLANKDNRTLHYGSNTYYFVAEYYDGGTVFKQMTIYLHESAGEKAKPVIYLYPEHPVRVTVTVSPKKGISVSDPQYHDGWTVDAAPDGTLTDPADGKTYPYLFWEAPESGVRHPKAGFVVKTDNLASFFDEKLTWQGLSRDEIADFKEYWLPVLTKGPYYYIHFYSREMIDADAPLSVTPQPDSVIRIYFDSRPLERPEKVEEQRLEKGMRRGFTVVEWGGRKY